jgi:hypothetical protein
MGQKRSFIMRDKAHLARFRLLGSVRKDVYDRYSRRDHTRCSKPAYSIIELPEARAEDVRKQLQSKYAYGELDGSPLHFLDAWSGVWSRDSWLWVDDFLKGTTGVLLFFDETDSRSMFNFRAALKWFTVLQHGSYCARPNYEFYLSNASGDYLIFYDHEETLYTAGTAHDWLERAVTEIYDLIGVPPRALYVTNIQIGSFGKQIIFECLYESEDRKPLRLIFRECGGIEWDTFASSNPVAKVSYVFLRKKCRGGEEGRSCATLCTRNFRIKVSYREISVEKNW